MQHRASTVRQRAFVSIVLILAPLGLSTACKPLTATAMATVSGHVLYVDSGAPYPGVTVLFRNVYKAEVHTDTDKNGYYTITLPDGTYAPFAVDNHSIVNAGFTLANQADSVVEVPPSSVVDFWATPTRSMYGG